MIDLHVHTWRCRHAEGAADEYVIAAADRKVSTIAFTEHLPLPPSLAARIPGAHDYAMPPEELPEYVWEVSRAAALGDELGVEVLLGVECDIVAEGIAHARESVAQYPFDVVLGSVHFIDDWAFDDPTRVDRYDEWRIDELWTRYFDDLIAAARSGVADVMAHADLVKKFCGAPNGSVDHLYANASDALREAGVAVEVNTAGLRKPCKELYPGLPFLKALSAAGVPVTIGSDAHAPDDVAAGAPQAVSALRSAGYRSVLVFRGRVAEEVGLDEL